MLENIITSKTRLRLLLKFFIHAANKGYLRGLAQEMNENTNAIRKELNNLSEAGFIVKEEKNNKVMYFANVSHPLFTSLQQLVQKYVGLDYIMEKVIDKVGNLNKIYLVGDYAMGIDSGTVEVVLEGEDINVEFIGQWLPKIEIEINKKLVIHTHTSYSGSGLLVFEK